MNSEHQYKGSNHGATGPRKRKPCSKSLACVWNLITRLYFCIYTIKVRFFAYRTVVRGAALGARVVGHDAVEGVRGRRVGPIAEEVPDGRRRRDGAIDHVGVLDAEPVKPKKRGGVKTGERRGGRRMQAWVCKVPGVGRWRVHLPCRKPVQPHETRGRTHVEGRLEHPQR